VSRWLTWVLWRLGKGSGSEFEAIGEAHTAREIRGVNETRRRHEGAEVSPQRTRFPKRGTRCEDSEAL